jgi:hypothetical protein
VQWKVKAKGANQNVNVQRFQELILDPKKRPTEEPNLASYLANGLTVGDYLADDLIWRVFVLPEFEEFQRQRDELHEEEAEERQRVKRRKREEENRRIFRRPQEDEHQRQAKLKRHTLRKTLTKLTSRPRERWA